MSKKPAPPPKKARKPYTISKPRENWTNDEHEKFLEAIKLYERDWKRIAQHIVTKTVIQIRSHAQKYFLKMQKLGKNECVPPPRHKRKAAEPYPRNTVSKGKPLRRAKSNSDESDDEGDSADGTGTLSDERKTRRAPRGRGPHAPVHGMSPAVFGSQPPPPPHPPPDSNSEQLQLDPLGGHSMGVGINLNHAVAAASVGIDGGQNPSMAHSHPFLTSAPEISLLGTGLSVPSRKRKHTQIDSGLDASLVSLAVLAESNDAAAPANIIAGLGAGAGQPVSRQASRRSSRKLPSTVNHVGMSTVPVHLASSSDSSSISATQLPFQFQPPQPQAPSRVSQRRRQASSRLENSASESDLDAQTQTRRSTRVRARQQEVVQEQEDEAVAPVPGMLINSVSPSTAVTKRNMGRSRVRDPAYVSSMCMSPMTALSSVATATSPPPPLHRRVPSNPLLAMQEAAVASTSSVTLPSPIPPSRPLIHWQSIERDELEQMCRTDVASKAQRYLQDSIRKLLSVSSGGRSIDFKGQAALLRPIPMSRAAVAPATHSGVPAIPAVPVVPAVPALAAVATTLESDHALLSAPHVRRTLSSSLALLDRRPPSQQVPSPHAFKQLQFSHPHSVFGDPFSVPSHPEPPSPLLLPSPGNPARVFPDSSQSGELLHSQQQLRNRFLQRHSSQQIEDAEQAQEREEHEEAEQDPSQPLPRLEADSGHTDSRLTLDIDPNLNSSSLSSQSAQTNGQEFDLEQEMKQIFSFIGNVLHPQMGDHTTEYESLSLRSRQLVQTLCSILAGALQEEQEAFTDVRQFRESPFATLPVNRMSPASSTPVPGTRVSPQVKIESPEDDGGRSAVLVQDMSLPAPNLSGTRVNSPQISATVIVPPILNTLSSNSAVALTPPLLPVLDPVPVLPSPRDGIVVNSVATPMPSSSSVGGASVAAGASTGVAVAAGVTVAGVTVAGQPHTPRRRRRKRDMSAAVRSSVPGHTLMAESGRNLSLPHFLPPLSLLQPPLSFQSPLSALPVELLHPCVPLPGLPQHVFSVQQPTFDATLISYQYPNAMGNAAEFFGYQTDPGLPAPFQNPQPLPLSSPAFVSANALPLVPSSSSSAFSHSAPFYPYPFPTNNTQPFELPGNMIPGAGGPFSVVVDGVIDSYPSQSDHNRRLSMEQAHPPSKQYLSHPYPGAPFGPRGASFSFPPTDSQSQPTPVSPSLSPLADPLNDILPLNDRDTLPASAASAAPMRESYYSHAIRDPSQHLLEQSSLDPDDQSTRLQSMMLRPDHVEFPMFSGLSSASRVSTIMDSQSPF